MIDPFLKNLKACWCNFTFNCWWEGIYFILKFRSQISVQAIKIRVRVRPPKSWPWLRLSTFPSSIIFFSFSKENQRRWFPYPLGISSSSHSFHHLLDAWNLGPWSAKTARSFVSFGFIWHCEIRNCSYIWEIIIRKKKVKLRNLS